MTSCLNKISKPHIVDLLRIFDKRKTISPRIRYASVRSKPELIKDLVKHFDCTESDDIVYFEPLCPTMDAPKIKYDLGTRTYIFNGAPVDVPKESREQPEFQIFHGPFLLNFEHKGPEPVCFQGRFYRPVQRGHRLRGLLIATGQHATKTDSVSSGEFREPDTQILSDWTGPFAPSPHCDSTPTSKSARRHSWDS